MIFGRVKVRPGMSARFEELVAELIVNTESEPLCTRYEYWRMSEPDTYFLMECFVDVNAFFAHVAAPYHHRVTRALEQCIEVLHSSPRGLQPGIASVPAIRNPFRGLFLSPTPLGIASSGNTCVAELSTPRSVTKSAISDMHLFGRITS